MILIALCFFLGEEIAPGYVEGKVHFNNSSISQDNPVNHPQRTSVPEMIRS